MFLAFLKSVCIVNYLGTDELSEEVSSVFHSLDDNYDLLEL